MMVTDSLQILQLLKKTALNMTWFSFICITFQHVLVETLKARLAPSLQQSEQCLSYLCIPNRAP